MVKRGKLYYSDAAAEKRAWLKPKRDYVLDAFMSGKIKNGKKE